MLDQLTVLAVIPARANSKGLPGKNTLPLAGKPLIGWSIDAAMGSAFIDRTIVSTDSPDIGQLAQSLGADVPFIRPAQLARDDTPGIEPILHACACLPGFDLVVVMQPTSPLRTSADIDAALHSLQESRADFCVSVTRPKHHPNWLFCEAVDGYLARYEESHALTVRQSLSQVFAPNGALYIARIAPLLAQRTLSGGKTVGYEMSADRSWDIDTAFDLMICESLIGACTERPESGQC